MSWILLTNDDGIDSPALAPFAAALGREHEVRACVPDSERSWSGKSMTRFDPVVAAEREPLPGTVATWTCSGTPADSANVGIHEIADTTPALVVSGINIGSNVGTAYLLSSGTVGAALEAWVCGVNAVAFSTNSAVVPWGEWVRHALSADGAEGWTRLAEVCTSLLDDVRETDLVDRADVVSVNLPWEADVDTRRRVTDVARTGYGRLFPAREREPGTPDDARRFTHDGQLTRFGDDGPTDLDTLHAGEVSITPLRAPGAMHLDDDLRRSVERG